MAADSLADAVIKRLGYISELTRSIFHSRRARSSNSRQSIDVKVVSEIMTSVQGMPTPLKQAPQMIESTE
jgi:hypothetical protein